ncbi:hypothetical protein BD410DRAFT_795369, partial [Rickenella mellea]
MSSRQYNFQQTLTPQSYQNGPPKRKRSCTYCQSKHYPCDKAERYPGDSCGNCQEANQVCVYPP